MEPRTLHKLSYGMYVIGSEADGRGNGQIANTVFQITSEPAAVAVSIAKANHSHGLIERGGRFSMSVLSEETPFMFIGRFGFRSGRDADKLEGCTLKTGTTGVPVVLDHAVAWLEAEVTDSLDAGSHTVFLGRVVEAEILNDGTPMTYSYYHTVVRGKAPKTAPTYIREERPK